MKLSLRDINLQDRLSALKFFGGVFEWPMEPAWKACKRENVSWVRIPPPPTTQRIRTLTLI